MWSVSRLHVAGTVAGCCPLVSALLSDSLRAAAGSRSAPPGVSTGTNPLRHPRVCDPWRHYVPPVGQAVKLSRKCPPLLLLMQSHRDHSERIYLLFSAQLVRSEFTWEPEQLLGFNMASSATGDREEQVSGLKRPRGALTQNSSAGLFLCWLVEREWDL